MRKNENLHIRVTPEQKEILMRAASLLGIDTSAFILQNSLREARKELQSIDKKTLSEEDTALFLDALVNPSVINNKLKEAYRFYDQVIDNKTKSSSRN